MKPPQKTETLRSDTRGVTWTIEATLSVTLLLAVLGISMSIVPSGGNTLEDKQESQLRQQASDILVGADSTGALQNATTFYDAQNDEWKDSNAQGTYVSVTPPQITGHPLEAPLQVAENDGMEYNMEVAYQTSSGEATKQIVYQGIPSGDAVAVEYTVILYDDTPVVGTSPGTCGASAGEHPTLAEVESASGCDFFAEDVFSSASTDRYNVVRVRLVAWR